MQDIIGRAMGFFGFFRTSIHFFSIMRKQMIGKDPDCYYTSNGDIKGRQSPPSPKIERKSSIINFLEFYNEILSNFNNMRTAYLSLFFFILTSQIHSQCCLRLEGRKCAQCPSGTHLFRGNCILDVRDCANYRDGFDCAACREGFVLNGMGDCDKIPTPVVNVSTPAVSAVADYTDLVIDPSTEAASTSDAFLMADDYFKGIKSQLATGQAVGARVRTYTNRTAETTVQYTDGKNNYFRGVIQMDMDAFVMKELSFAKISAPTLAPGSPASTTITQASTTPTPLTTQTITLTNPIHITQVSLVEPKLLAANPSISAYKSGNITTISDGSFSLSMLYSSKIGSSDILVTATVSKDKEVKILTANALLARSGPTSTTSITNTITGNQPTDIMNLYQPFDTLSDDFFIIVKDFTWGQFPQLNNSQPTSAKKYTQSPITNYLLRFTKPDGSIWQYSQKFNSDLFLISIDKTTQISPPTRPPPTPTFIKIDPTQIYKDIYFIIASEYINRQSKDKYKDAPVRSVDKMEVNGVISYRVSYEVGNRVWEVSVNVGVANFVASGFFEVGKETINKAAPTAAVNTTTSNTTTPTSSIMTNNNGNGIGFGFGSGNGQTQTVVQTKNQTQSQSQQQNTTTTPLPTPSPTPSTPIITITTNTTTQASNQTNTSTTSNQITQTQTNQTSQTISATVNSVANIVKPTTTDDLVSTRVDIVSTRNATSTSTSSTSSTSITSIPIPVTPPTTTPSTPAPTQQIQQLASGLTPLTRTDQSLPEFRQIDALIRSANPNELKNSLIVGAYVKTSSFTKNYQIYYMQTGTSQDIWAAVVSRDQLRKRTYIISFNRIGF